MPVLFEKLANRLQAIGHPVRGEVASAVTVERLFRVVDENRIARAGTPLSPRLCEEHLATALAAARQSIAERQLFFNAGEKFALLTLSLTSDESEARLLASEAGALQLRQTASDVAMRAEEATTAAARAHAVRLAEHVTNLAPGGTWAPRDAERNGFLAYIGRSVSAGFNNMEAFWGSANQSDAQPSDSQSPLTLQPRTAVVDLESSLARRATLASFRVLHDRARVDEAAVAVGVTATEGRANALRAGVQFDSAVATLGRDRAAAASELLADKIALSNELALFGFERQMALHRERAHDLHDEAAERASVALIGFRDIYGFTLPDIPASTLETVEQLLRWCRDTARVVTGEEPRVARQRVTFSLREIAGVNWKRQIPRGVAIDARSLANLGSVVRVRDLVARFTGEHRSTFALTVTTPIDAMDRDLTGVVDRAEQAATAIRIVAISAGDDEAVRPSVARVVHNLCPSGTWQVQAPAVAADVDDLLLDLDVSYFLG